VNRHNLRKRAWCITNFNDELWYPENAVYNLICSDTTEDGKPHFHQYLYFKNPIAQSTVKKNYPTAHIEVEISQGSYIDYIKLNKNGRKEIIYEEGQEPRKHLFASINDVEKMDPSQRKDLPIQYFNIVEKINTRENNDIDIDSWAKEVKVYWIWGKSGVGKTEKAKEIVRANAEKYGRKVNIVKYENGFWSGIGNAKIAIYDDFRDSHMKPSEFINFIDYNWHNLNVKGSVEKNVYELIIFTSVQDPENIYLNVGGEPRKQWLRRMEIIHLKTDNDIDIDDW